MNVSRRASSVYQFFQYKEELRTAKISAFVIVLAFACWGPFFITLTLLTLLRTSTPAAPSSGPSKTASSAFAESSLIFWSHHLSNLASLGFAALSPYLYVFRSSRVQKCLGQVIYDTFCCRGSSVTSEAGNGTNATSYRHKSSIRHQRSRHSSSRSWYRITSR